TPLAPLAPQRTGANELRAIVIHIDRFGNCITNVARQDLSTEELARGITLTVAGRVIRHFVRFFAEGRADQPFLYWGSAGFLEIALA
ncbi:SAM hydroxide adenosyltransferase, partial [Acinetobacter baumannii]